MIVRVLGIVLLMILIAGIILIQKSRIRKKRLWSVLLAVVWFIVYFCYSAVPLEEPFLTFPTVEEAFHYKSDDEILLIVEGNESTQVVCRFRSGGCYGAILPKTEKGWKPEIQWNKREIATIFAPSCSFFLQRYKDTDDFYLSIVSAGGMDELFDNRSTEFQSVTDSSFFGKKVAPGYYFAFVDGVDDDYVLTIDGEEYTFPDAK